METNKTIMYETIIHLLEEKIETILDMPLDDKEMIRQGLSTDSQEVGRLTTYIDYFSIKLYMERE